MNFKILMLFLAVVSFGCDQSEKGEINTFFITRIASDYPFEVEDNYRGKEYRSYPYYHIGDTLHLQIDMEVNSGQMNFVDLYVSNFFARYQTVNEWINEDIEGDRIIDFKTYYFKDNKLSLDYEIVVNNDMIYESDSSVTIELRYGQQDYKAHDEFNMILRIQP